MGKLRFFAQIYDVIVSYGRSSAPPPGGGLLYTRTCALLPPPVIMGRAQNTLRPNTPRSQIFRIQDEGQRIYRPQKIL